MSLGNAVEPDFDPIAAALRQMHDGIASEPVPDDFLSLLDQLESRMAEKGKKPS
ncbi:NepR family anti-sigma factor [Sphingorhabdus contaminans]|uniref:NepR family anti-sigma factor n=1 Tax=Sphingorhabdus contaminans TaxID=1343899 RepID=UPI003D26EA17